MTVEVRSVGEVRIIDVKGDLDLKEAPKLREKLFLALKEVHKVALNLSGIRYVDSSGIAVMIEALMQSQRTSREFILFGMNPTVYNVFKLTHVIKIFKVSETEDQALQRLAS